jgi:hypothetical protein
VHGPSLHPPPLACQVVYSMAWKVIIRASSHLRSSLPPSLSLSLSLSLYLPHYVHIVSKTVAYMTYIVDFVMDPYMSTPLLGTCRRVYYFIFSTITISAIFISAYLHDRPLVQNIYLWTLDRVCMKMKF